MEMTTSCEGGQKWPGNSPLRRENVTILLILLVSIGGFINFFLFQATRRGSSTGNSIDFLGGKSSARITDSSIRIGNEN